MAKTIIRTVSIHDGSMRLEVSSERLQTTGETVYAVEITRPHETLNWQPDAEQRRALIVALGGTVPDA